MQNESRKQESTRKKNRVVLFIIIGAILLLSIYIFSWYKNATTGDKTPENIEELTKPDWEDDSTVQRDTINEQDSPFKDQLQEALNQIEGGLSSEALISLKEALILAKNSQDSSTILSLIEQEEAKLLKETLLADADQAIKSGKLLSALSHLNQALALATSTTEKNKIKRKIKDVKELLTAEYAYEIDYAFNLVKNKDCNEAQKRIAIADRFEPYIDVTDWKEKKASINISCN